MKRSKIRTYLISGTLLTFLALKDIEHFNIFYNGIALGLGLTGLILAAIKYKSKVKKRLM